ncbi:enoyl-CoA hydratase [Thalassotalea agarivorans]|uniref:Enoyl-CoA hydratase/carnithine racemase n=1 Tax=Thalassotalea agarivorans TaxID=349064 RepID=A0A1I0HZH4_THASX|nr:enoyl-CoA hydratase [Thalassotalea agarivorans]SET89501.1 Enoyl-CoA hydratase/carnithine racemase [Thalassotalea agarivorans]
MSDSLILEKQGNTAVITFNNPPAHTWTHESLSMLAEMVEGLNQDKDIYALVVTGSGEKFFSAGADLNVFADGDKQVAADMAEIFGKAFETLSDFRGVSIAAINGYAMGGGLEVALACDIRIAEAHAVMALPEATVGLLPCAGGTQNLQILVGEGWTKRMILCGERIDAQQALSIGLVEEVVEAKTSLTAALALASKVANQSPVAVAACKSLIQQHRHQPIRSALPSERAAFVDLFDSQDQKEGVAAFLEKRKAVWKNA